MSTNLVTNELKDQEVSFCYDVIMNKIILIGGAPGVGKSTLAKEIASARGANWISTDQIRTIMQKATKRDLKPELFVDANSSNDSGESVILEIKKAEAVWEGVAEFIKQNHPWEGCVIEGTAILPHLVASDFKDNPDILPIFLVQSEESIKNVIEQRSKDPWINTKTPEQKKKKAEQTILLNNIFKQEAIKNGYTVRELNGFTDAYDDIVTQATIF